MFKISNLQAKLTELQKPVLHGVDMEIQPGEIHLIMGPNGAGKSTLAKAMMKHPSLEVEGKIELDGEDISNLETFERAQKGLFIGHQLPVEISGVKLIEFLRIAYNESVSEDEKLDPWAFMDIFEVYAKVLGFDQEFSTRYLNEGFSGGEKKKSEVLQMLIMKPKYAILDEIDSGLDLDSLKIIFNNISDFARKSQSGVMIITHNPKILDYITPDKAHLLKDGMITQTGGVDLVKSIIERGYAYEDGEK